MGDLRGLKVDEYVVSGRILQSFRFHANPRRFPGAQKVPREFKKKFRGLVASKIFDIFKGS